MACFPLNMYYYTFLQIYLQHSLSFQEKMQRDINVKYLGLRLKCVILRPVTTNVELLDKFR